MLVVWKYTPGARRINCTLALWSSLSHMHHPTARRLCCTHIPRVPLHNNDRLCAIRARWLLFYDVLLIQRGAFALCVGAPEISHAPIYILYIISALWAMHVAEMRAVCQTRGVCFLQREVRPCNTPVPFRIVCARIGLGADENVAWKIEAGRGVILDDDAVRTRQVKNVTRSGKLWWPKYNTNFWVEKKCYMFGAWFYNIKIWYW